MRCTEPRAIDRKSVQRVVIAFRVRDMAVDRQVLVDPSWIREHLDDPGVRLIEVDVSPVAYREGHIPGAVLWDAYADLRDAGYVPVAREELESLLSRAGAVAEATLVTYGYGAPLGFWLLTAMGHDDVRMLDGPRDRWSAVGGEWSTELPEPLEGSYRLPPPRADLIASRREVEAAITDPGKILIDVRSEFEFDGERFWPSGASEDTGRAGRIPGAVNVPVDLLREEDGSLMEAGELHQVLKGAGVDASKDLIIYCTIGNRASQAWFGMSYVLGYPSVSVYYGSWVEWGKAAGTPIQ
jgi:thiosulfate/3-mercaptopyruvate sulfurtransferase